jgi:hypothetical protein
MLLLLLYAAWRIASIRVHSLSDLINQGQLLYSGASLLLTAVVAGATIVYTKHTKAMVGEMHKARVADAEGRSRGSADRDFQEIVGVVAALTGATGDAVGSCVVLAAALRRRLSPTARRLGQGYFRLSTDSVAAAAAALERLRYVAPGDVVDAGERLFADLQEHFQCAVRRCSEAEMTATASAVGRSRTDVSVRVSELRPAAQPSTGDKAQAIRGLAVSAS